MKKDLAYKKSVLIYILFKSIYCHFIFWDCQRKRDFPSYIFEKGLSFIEETKSMFRNTSENIFSPLLVIKVVREKPLSYKTL